MNKMKPWVGDIYCIYFIAPNTCFNTKMIWLPNSEIFLSDPQMKSLKI